MDNSSDMRVQTFLETMREMDFEKYKILQDARAIVLDAAPDIKERFIYGGIMFCHQDVDIGGVFASKKHVSFEFTHGFQFNDPDETLEGSGKFRRHLKLRADADLTVKDVAGFVKQALALSGAT